MKRPFPYLLPCVLLVLAGCQDLKNSAMNTYESLYDMGEPQALAEAAGMKTTPDRLIAEGQCPVADVVPELADYFALESPDDAGTRNFTSHVRLDRVDATCDYGPKSVTVEATLSFTGDGGTGPLSYPYFVSILTPGGKIIAKQVFDAKLDFTSEQKPVLRQKLRQIIPVDNKETGASHRVLFGFQLSPDQLTYNRARLREKESAEKRFQIEQNEIIRERSPEESGVVPPPAAPVKQPPIAAPPPAETGAPIILAPEGAQ